jgi:hypothetical protein
VQQFLLAGMTIGLTVLSASALRGFIYGVQQDHPEGYVLLVSLLSGLAAALSLFRLTKH